MNWTHTILGGNDFAKWNEETVSQICMELLILKCENGETTISRNLLGKKKVPTICSLGYCHKNAQIKTLGDLFFGLIEFLKIYPLLKAKYLFA